MDQKGAWSIFQKSWSRTSRTNNKMHLIPDFAMLSVVWNARGLVALKGFSGGQRSAPGVTLIVLIA